MPIIVRSLALAFLVLALGGCDAVLPSVGPVDFDTLSHDPTALVGTWDLEREWTYWTGTREVSYPREVGSEESWAFGAGGDAVHVVASGPIDWRHELEYGVVAPPGRTPYLEIGGHPYSFGIDGEELILKIRGVGDASEQVYRRRD